MYSFFWAIPRSLNFMCRRFGTLFEDRTDRVFRKARYIKFSRRGITEKKEYNIPNKEKVWNQEKVFMF